MKVEINAKEQTMLATAIQSKIAQLERNINTEADPEVKEIRRKSLNEYQALHTKLYNGELKV